MKIIVAVSLLILAVILFLLSKIRWVHESLGTFDRIASIVAMLAAVIVFLLPSDSSSVQINSSAPSPTPVKTIMQTPSTTPIALITPSPAPSASPPMQESTRSGITQPPKVINNDIGKSKANDFYEITMENAWASRDPVRLDICNFNVPSGQKAILVRFTIRRSSPPRTNEEILRLGYTQTTDFVLIDDQNRRLDPGCLVTGIVLGASDRAVNRTLAYLVPAGSEHVSFRFQKSGAGQPIVFDLSGLD